MKTIEIFDPALCCPMGLCGPNINPELMRMATVTDTLKKKGINISRHNLKEEPGAFVSNGVVNQCLPFTGQHNKSFPPIKGTGRNCVD